MWLPLFILNIILCFVLLFLVFGYLLVNFQSEEEHFKRTGKPRAQTINWLKIRFFTCFLILIITGIWAIMINPYGSMSTEELFQNVTSALETRDVLND